MLSCYMQPHCPHPAGDRPSSQPRDARDTSFTVDFMALGSAEGREAVADKSHQLLRRSQSPMDSSTEDGELEGLKLAPWRPLSSDLSSRPPHPLISLRTTFRLKSQHHCLGEPTVFRPPFWGVLAPGFAALPQSVLGCGLFGDMLLKSPAGDLALCSRGPVSEDMLLSQRPAQSMSELGTGLWVGRQGATERGPGGSLAWKSCWAFGSGGPFALVVGFASIPDVVRTESTGWVAKRISETVTHEGQGQEGRGHCQFYLLS